MFKWKQEHKLNFLEITEFKKRGITAVFTSRKNGFSSKPYQSLNLGLHTCDETETVLKNREKLCQVLDIELNDLVAGEQIHGDKVYVVDKKDRGKGALKFNKSISGIDALITDKCNIPLISFYADCVPLYILDPVNKAVGLAHAGWKGTVSKIGKKTILEMKKVFNTKIKNCWIGIGPAISQKYYEVDEKIVQYFKKSFPYWDNIITRNQNNNYNLDLKLTNLLLFKSMGVPLSQIIKSDLCTYNNEQYFYSYRRNRKTGRMASLIMIE